MLHARASAGEDEGGPQHKSADAAASVLHVEGEKVEIDLLQAKAGAWNSGEGIGMSASANLAEMKVLGVNAKVGFGLDTGIGFRNQSVTVEALGTGVSLGRQTKVSVLGNEVGVDIDKCSVM